MALSSITVVSQWGSAMRGQRTDDFSCDFLLLPPLTDQQSPWLIFETLGKASASVKLLGNTNFLNSSVHRDGH